MDLKQIQSWFNDAFETQYLDRGNKKHVSSPMSRFSFYRYRACIEEIICYAQAQHEGTVLWLLCQDLLDYHASFLRKHNSGAFNFWDACLKDSWSDRPLGHIMNTLFKHEATIYVAQENSRLLSYILDKLSLASDAKKQSARHKRLVSFLTRALSPNKRFVWERTIIRVREELQYYKVV